MAKRANKRRMAAKKRRNSKSESSCPPAVLADSCAPEPLDPPPGDPANTHFDEELDHEIDDAALAGTLDDPFFYESPFPPEVELDPPAPAPALCSPELMARRRKLRTFVAMVVGVAATITLLGLGKNWLEGSEVSQARSMTVPVSP